MKGPGRSHGSHEVQVQQERRWRFLCNWPRHWSKDILVSGTVSTKNYKELTWTQLDAGDQLQLTWLPAEWGSKRRSIACCTQVDTTVSMHSPWPGVPRLESRWNGSWQWPEQAIARGHPRSCCSAKCVTGWWFSADQKNMGRPMENMGKDMEISWSGWWWLEHDFYFSIYWDCHHPQLTNLYFSEG